MHLDDRGHGVGIGEADIVKKAAAQERVGQFLLIVRGDDHHGTPARFDRLAGFIDEELHAIELEQEIVREFDVSLVDLVDQQDRPLVGNESVPQFAALDVVANVLDARVAELAVTQTGNRVVFVKPLQRLGSRLDVPLDQRCADCLRNFKRQHGLASAGLALDQQRPLQRDRGIDRNLEVVGGDIASCAFETHAISHLFRGDPKHPIRGEQAGFPPVNVKSV